MKLPKLSVNAKAKTKLRNTRIAFLFILPAFALISVFVIYPFCTAFYRSFFQIHPYIADEFIGWQNYKIVITDKYFWYSIWVGVKYILCVIPIQFIFAFAIALFIKSTSCRGFFRLLPLESWG